MKIKSCRSSILFLLFGPGCLVAAPGRYDAIDRHALSVPAWAERTQAGLAAYLVRPARTDEEKARAIFRWIAENIAYDTQSLAAGGVRAADPEDAFRTRTAMCSGYAELFGNLAREAGLEAEIVNGFAKGVDYRIGKHFRGAANHAWNAVRLNGSWKLIDATWGAGHMNESGRYVRELDEHYFLTPPDQMIFTHLPEEERWQLLDVPVPMETFEKQVYLKSAFFKYGMGLKSHRLGFIEAAKEISVVFSTPREVRLSAQLIRGQRIWDESLTFVQHGAQGQTVMAVFPAPGTYTLRIFAKDRDDPGAYEWAADYLVHATVSGGSSAGFPEVYQPFDLQDCTLVRPMEGRLKAGRTYQFAIQIPGAEKAFLVTGKKWIELKNNGDLFKAGAVVSRGETQIVARFPGDGDKYNVLLKYTGY
jgi:hypothetical protein